MPRFASVPYIYDAQVPQEDGSKACVTFGSCEQIVIPQLSSDQAPMAGRVHDRGGLEHLRYYDGKLWFPVGPINDERMPFKDAQEQISTIEKGTVETSPFFKASAAGSSHEPTAPGTYPTLADWVVEAELKDYPTGYQDRREEALKAIRAVQLIAVQDENGKEHLWEAVAPPYYEIQGNDSVGYHIQVVFEPKTHERPEGTWSATERYAAVAEFRAKMARLQQPNVAPEIQGFIDVFLPDLELWKARAPQLVRGGRPEALDFRA